MYMTHMYMTRLSGECVRQYDQRVALYVSRKTRSCGVVGGAEGRVDEGIQSSLKNNKKMGN